MITLADAKLNIRQAGDVTHEDGLVQRLVDSATRYIERRTGWYLGPPETLTTVLYGDGTRTLWLPQPPHEGTVEVEDSSGEAVEDFTVRGARLIRTDGRWAYGEEYTVAYDAGFEAGDGPPDLMQATRLLVAGWYENREAWAVGTITADHKQGVDQIVGAYERVRV